MLGPAFVDDRAAARVDRLRRQLAGLADVPLPGTGATGTRLERLAAAGRTDASLGRLTEGHLDAVAILAELGTGVPAGCLLGVWAARPDQLRTTATSDGWQLRGVKPWCSGGAALDRALLTAVDDDGRAHLFDVEVARLTFRDDWHPMGMRASDSRTADVDLSIRAADEVGEPGCYVRRPGFGHGGVGVAAVWYGIADRLGADLAARSAEKSDPHLAAAAGDATALLAAAASTLRQAADQIDATPGDADAAIARAGVVRLAVASISRQVASIVTAAGGATPLAFDAAHGRAVADLTVYLGQLHHGHDAANVRRSPAWVL